MRLIRLRQKALTRRGPKTIHQRQMQQHYFPMY